MKKCDDWPKIPTVPGPVMSARTLTNENAPLMTPKPNPDTAQSTEMFTYFQLSQLNSTTKGVCYHYWRPAAATDSPTPHLATLLVLCL